VPFGYTVHGIVRYERPHDVAHVLGNPDKARRQLALAIQIVIRLPFYRNHAEMDSNHV
jgi:hypothetical protein